MKRVIAGSVLFLVFFSRSSIGYDTPPPACAGTETFRLEIQASVDGYTWHSNSIPICGYPGAWVYLAVRTRMTVTSGQTQGWSFGAQHDASGLLPYGGNISILDLTTAGTGTATVQNGNPPDTEATEVRAGFNGYTQGVVIDSNQAITLGPTTNFVTSRACYGVQIPSSPGIYQATLKFVHTIGGPPIDTVITQQSRSNIPCARNLWLYVTAADDEQYFCSAPPSPYCGFGGAGAMSGGQEGKLDPLGGGAQGQGAAPCGVKFRRGDASENGTLNISDPIAILALLFLGDPPPTCLATTDANDDARTNVSDPIWLFSFLFLGTSPPPPPPWPECGLDPTVPVILECAAYSICPPEQSPTQNGPPRNASQLLGHQSETAVAIKPSADPNALHTVAIVSNLWNQQSAGPGLLYSRSTDGGVQFTPSIVFADPNDPLHPQAVADPSLAFDRFGNLYVSYVPTAESTGEVAVSTDGGSSFASHRTISASIDQPTIVTGPSSVADSASIWVTGQERVPPGPFTFRIIAAGAKISGTGMLSSFQVHQVTDDPLTPGVEGCTDNPGTPFRENCFFNYGDIAVGPQGEVVLTYQDGSWIFLPTPCETQSTRIFVHYRPAADPTNPTVKRSQVRSGHPSGDEQSVWALGR